MREQICENCGRDRDPAQIDELLTSLEERLKAPTLWVKCGSRSGFDHTLFTVRSVANTFESVETRAAYL